MARASSRASWVNLSSTTPSRTILSNARSGTSSHVENSRSTLALSAYADKAKVLREFSTWEDVPERAFDNIVRLGVVLDKLTQEARLDALAIRCWTEIQQQMGISPCVAMGVLNETGLASACEVDLGNAVAMRALHLASYNPIALMDWNHNYGDEENKCILFHCGPAPASMMQGKGRVTDHLILMNTVGCL